VGVEGGALAAAVRRLGARPLLLALLSCQSAGRGYGSSLSALGPLLAGAGVLAVLAFQGDVAVATARAFLPALLGELARDGRVDRALAAVRAALGERLHWWQPILWLRTDGRLWVEPPARSADGVPAVTPTQQGDEQAVLHERLERHRGTLAHYLRQLAITGSAHARPEVVFEIAVARVEIRRITAALRAAGAPATDRFDDEP
jgi:hypothetical protein